MPLLPGQSAPLTITDAVSCLSDFKVKCYVRLDLVALPHYNVFASRLFTSEVGKGRKKAAAKSRTAKGDNSDGIKTNKGVPKVQIDLKRRQLLIQKSVEPCFCKSHMMCQGVKSKFSKLGRDLSVLPSDTS